MRLLKSTSCARKELKSLHIYNRQVVRKQQQNKLVNAHTNKQV